MVAWASFYADGKVNETASEDWIKSNARKAPASHVILNGQYNFNLLKPAKLVSDALDSTLCPKTNVKVRKFFNIVGILMLDHHSIPFNWLYGCVHLRRKISYSSHNLS